MNDETVRKLHERLERLGDVAHILKEEVKSHRPRLNFDNLSKDDVNTLIRDIDALGVVQAAIEEVMSILGELTRLP